MPRNTGAGIVISLFALILGFALIWHIWWLAIASFVGCIVTAVVRSYDDDVDYYVPAEDVARIETARIQSLAKLKQA